VQNAHLDLPADSIDNHAANTGGLEMMLKKVMVFVVGTCLTTAVQASDDMIKRGEYLSRIMDCTGCHTPGAMTGKPEPGKFLAGSTIGFGIPQVGVVYPPNLTQDTETGLGSWSEADIVTAVRTGVRPDGRQLVPVMPWPSYSALTDEDAHSLAAYLKTLPPVRNAVPRMAGPNEKPPAPYLTVTGG
jgi:mono/diheme cytochrome c family protein